MFSSRIWRRADSLPCGSTAQVAEPVEALERALRDALTELEGISSFSLAEIKERLIQAGWRSTKNPVVLCHYGYSDSYRVCFDVQQLILRKRSPVFASNKRVRGDLHSLPGEVWERILQEHGF